MNVNVTLSLSVIVPPAACERSTHVLSPEGGTALPSQFAGSLQLVPSPAPVQTWQTAIEEAGLPLNQDESAAAE